jgi:hypothetical protein
MGELTADLQNWVNRAIVWKDNGLAPRSAYGFHQYDQKKIGICHHIPVCETLAQLTAYFNGGASQGSTHFGNGRDAYVEIEAGGYRFWVSEIHQYMAVTGIYSPWAQGVINNWGSCAIQQAPLVAGMASGEPNAAFVSVENVAMTGADGLTDAQWNNCVMLRAWSSMRFDHPCDPLTNIWHAEVDRVNRCSDPGWRGEDEDAMQATANRVLQGDYSRMKGAVLIAPPPEPEPEPKPEPPIAVDYRRLYEDELRGELAAYTDDGTRAAVRIDEVNRKLAELG